MPIGLTHDGADRNDHKLLKDTLDSIPIKRPRPTRKRPQGLCLDKGYDNKETRELMTTYRFTPHIRSRDEEMTDKLRIPGWRARAASLPSRRLGSPHWKRRGWWPRGIGP